MKIDILDDEFHLSKELTHLDKFVVDFLSILNKLKIDYVIISGYIPILFGRSRSSEDVDMLIDNLQIDDFHKLWEAIGEGFECLNTLDLDDAFQEYLSTGHAIRFSRKRKFIPNMEVKFPKNDLDRWTLKERRKVLLNEQSLFISPLELQIPFKLFLGSEKDIEDARYLYDLFKEKLDADLLGDFNQKLNTKKLFDEYLL